MLKKCIFVLSLVPCFTYAHDVNKRDIAVCAAETSSVQRLACFDSLSNRIGVATPKVSVQKSSGKWKKQEEVSPLDDSTNIYIRVSGNETIPNRYNKLVTPELVIRCKENTTALSVWWGTYLGLNSTYVTYRVDKLKPKKTKWSLSTKNEHIGKWSGSSSIPFIKQLLGKEKLLMQLTPYGENSVMTTFDISGIEEAIKPLRKQCKW
ncbi:type VI secretion system-associated protein TagO [Vibrio sp. A2-1]|uniref:type VI secretion system-associated protein TagO n=1 Tax=Vibrio sp. A2-1 TaxID=2912252 RepID=UPI001F379590|nr:type VI secretion system-associated protein TagO [Vibrio sp. A2-1]MCF7486709.1 type VI secretion protein [Vibrio sp. A2-1]